VRAKRVGASPLLLSQKAARRGKPVIPRGGQTGRVS
jgi:hypothetical protein